MKCSLVIKKFIHVDKYNNFQRHRFYVIDTATWIAWLHSTRGISFKSYEGCMTGCDLWKSLYTVSLHIFTNSASWHGSMQVTCHVLMLILFHNVKELVLRLKFPHSNFTLYFLHVWWTLFILNCRNFVFTASPLCIHSQRKLEIALNSHLFWRKFRINLHCT